nr:MAG: putative RNA-dependent RNA polymerase [Totiviridae sp.]
MGNLITYLIVFGLEWFNKIKSWGIFSNYITFSVLSRKIGSKIKFLNTSLELKQKFAEFNCLLGYQQLPFEGDGIVAKPFDYFSEIKNLANGGNKHGLRNTNWENTFKESLKEVSKSKLYEEREYIEFEEYVKKGKWLTSGSSSIGHVEWEFDGDKGKFKARKNMIENVYTENELWQLVKNWDGTIKSRAIIKGEMSKIRLAVASNIEMYIYESYLMYLSGHVYKNWYGITLDQNTNEALNDNILIRTNCKEGNYLLPFDYAAFDHQVTTWEVQQITEFYYKLGLKNVPDEKFIYVQNLITKTVKAYSKSTISGEYKGKFEKLDVIGGLPSGIRTTSLIGNIWNSIVTNIMKNLVVKLLGYNPIVHLSLRGDDSLIICRKPQECYLIRVCYLSINAIGHSNKFAIMKGTGEFLRNYLTKENVIGWVNRAIPSLTQRKPWNPEPWEDNHEVTTIKNNIDLLERRSSQDLEKLHLANKISWSKITKLSTKWLELPRRLGGVGIYNFKGYIPDKKLPKISKYKIDFENINIKYPKFSWIELTDDQLTKVNKIDLQTKIVADDIPGFQSKFHRNLMDKYKQLKLNWQKTELDLISPKIDYTYLPTCKYPTIIKRIRPKNYLYKEMPIWEFLRQYGLVRQVDETVKPMTEYLKEFYPQFYKDMKKWERIGWHRTDAINLAMGELVIEPTDLINSQLTDIVKLLVWKTDIKKTFGRKKIAIKLSRYTKYMSKVVSQDIVSTYFRY